MIRRHRFLFPLALSPVLLAWAPAPARADPTKVQCIDANVKGQDLRRDGKLSAAREQLRACANPFCPVLVRDDCTERLDELERAQPTIAFEVKDDGGADLIHVRVSVDGRPVLDQLDGKPVNVDPGAHVFTFEVSAYPPSTRTIVVTEGQKGRRERVTILRGPSPEPAPPVAPRPSLDANPPVAAQADTASATGPAPATGGIGAQKILGLVVSGVGVAGVAVGSLFGLMTLSQKSQQETACPSATACSPGGHALAVGDHSTGMTDSTISTVGFIAGGALLTTGAVLFFTSSPSPERSPSSRILVIPSAGPRGGAVFLRGAL
jgi:hypothetical protein